MEKIFFNIGIVSFTFNSKNNSYFRLSVLLF